MSSPEVLIVGGGPAGLSCGISLLRRGAAASVVLLEKLPRCGGICGGFERHGLAFDFGSHRIHSHAGGRVLDLLGSLPGLSLRRRRRNGRVLLDGRLVRFPPAPADLLMRLPPRFLLGVLRDQIPGRAGGSSGSGIDFETASVAGVGRTMAEAFYIPYAKKLWGLEASEISAEQAARRISARGRGRLVGKALMGLPGLSRFDPARFFSYPDGGFGSLASALAAEFERLGGLIRTSWPVDGMARSDGGVTLSSSTSGESVSGDLVFWSAPLREIPAAMGAVTPPSVGVAAGDLASRSMVLLYLLLGGGRYTPYDAHYFPGGDMPFSRLSEPSNYGRDRPSGDMTGLCIEIPCTMGDPVWSSTDGELGDLASSIIARTPLPLPRPLEIWTVRLEDAYPLYRKGFESSRRLVEEWVAGAGAVVPIGRQGLFAHDNMHHAVETGLAAADCVSPEGFVRESWERHRQSFRSHCVSD